MAWFIARASGECVCEFNKNLFGDCESILGAAKNKPTLVVPRNAR